MLTKFRCNIHVLKTKLGTMYNIALNLLLHVQVSWEKDLVNMIEIYLGGKTMGALSITSLFKLNLFFLNNAGFTFGWFSFLLPLSSAMTN